MPLVINGSPEEQIAEVYGKQYMFKAGEIKRLSEDEAFFLESKKADQGFQTLPAKFEEDFSFQGTDEGKKIVEERKARGLQNYAQRLKEIVRNVEVSLSRDMKQHNIETSPWAQASEGEMQALEKLAKLQLAEKDAEQERVKKAEALTKKLRLADGN